MKPMLLALTLVAFSVILWPATDAVAVAQEEKVARGTISEIGGTSLTLKVRGEPLTVNVDRETRVQAPGGSSKMRQANMTGKSGPHLAELLKVGQSVAVTYKDVPSPRASLVRAIPSAGSDGGSVKTASEMRSIGTVKAVGPASITISGNSGGGASYTQTFMIGPDTMVVGKGAGTASAANGGKAPVKQLISAGDRVSVSYHKTASGLHASDVRVTMKGTGSH
jgi:hypothetical protein